MFNIKYSPTNINLNQRLNLIQKIPLKNIIVYGKRYLKNKLRNH